MHDVAIDPERAELPGRNVILLRGGDGQYLVIRGVLEHDDDDRAMSVTRCARIVTNAQQETRNDGTLSNDPSRFPQPSVRECGLEGTCEASVAISATDRS